MISVSMMWVKMMLPLGMSLMLVHLMNGLLAVASGKDIDSILIGT